MKGISTTAKFAIGAGTVIALVFYTAIVDLGVNAGRIHRGVRVGTIDVGGLTQREAADRLEAVGRKMRNETITFASGIVDFEISPADLWRPRAADMARNAMSVGREGGWGHAASLRWRAWFGGVEVSWEPAVPSRIDKEIGELSEELDEIGLDLDETAMRSLLDRAISEWPRRDSYELPLVES